MYYINDNVKDLYRVKFHDERDGVLRLDMNENPDGLPVEFVEFVKSKITPQLIARYPEKGNLAKLLAEHNGVLPENISITSGSDEAMRLIFQCFGENGKNVITVTPTFEMYDVYAKMFGMEHVEVPYNSDFSLDRETFLSKITNDTSLVVLLNPNSPIGVCWDKEDVEEIIERATHVGAIVIIDEAYYYFCKKTFIKLIYKYDNLLVLRTFSKLFSCAGLRIGYVSGHSELIHYIENAESTFNVNNVAILFAEEVLSHPEMIEELRLVEEEGKNWLRCELLRLGYEVLSGEGNYLLVKPHSNSKEIVSLLKEHGIWIRDYSKGILSGWIRISTGAKRQMEDFLTAFLKIENIIYSINEKGN